MIMQIWGIDESLVFIILGSYIALIAVKLIFSWRFMKDYLVKKREKDLAPTYIFAMSLFFLLLAISRFLFGIFDYITFWNPDLGYTAAVLWKVAMCMSLAGLAGFYYQLETRVLKSRTKGAITIVILVLVGLTAIYPVTDKESFEMGQIFSTIVILLFVSTPVMYFWVAVKVPGMKKNATLTGIGIVIYMLGAFMTFQFMEGIFAQISIPWGSVYIISQFVKIVGLILIGLTAFPK